MREDEREEYEFDCDDDRRFDRDIEIDYERLDTGEDKTADGKVERD